MDTFRRIRFCAIALLVLWPAAAFAVQPGWYVVLDAGQARYSGVAGNVAGWLSLPPTDVPPPQPDSDALVSCCARATAASSNSTDTAYRLTLGYQINRYFGLEAAYVDLGSIDNSGRGTFGTSYQCPLGDVCPDLEGVEGYAGTASLRDRGWAVAATGSWQVTSRWSLFGRAGMFDSHARLDANSIPGEPTSPANPFAANAVHYSAEGWEPTYGVGVDFAPMRHWALRLGWDRYANLGDRIIGTFSVNLYSLGVVYTL